MLYMCCGIPDACGEFPYWSLWGLGNDTEGINSGWFIHADFTWKNEGRNEFRVDISCELIRVNEESIRMIVSIPIP